MFFLNRPPSSPRPPLTIDPIPPVTAPANKLSRLPEMNTYSQGTETFEQFAVRIAEMLKDAQKFEELFPYLQKVGFQTA